MPGPIDTKFNQVQNDSAPADSDVGSDYDPGWGEDPYAVLNDPSDSGFEGDFGFGDTSDPFGGGSGVPSAPTDPVAFEAWLRELKSNGDITEAEFDQYRDQVQGTYALSPSGQASALQQIADGINTRFAEVAAVAQDAADGTNTNEELKAELEEYKNTLNDNPNLTAESREGYLEDLDQWISAIDLGTADFEQIQGTFEELKAEVAEASLYSPEAQSLSEITDMSPEDIEEAAEKHNLDLRDLPEPPTMAVIEFLKEISPELGEKFSAVEEAVDARQEFIDETIDACESLNSKNSACTSDGDDKNLGVFQDLYDLKHHQDQKSNDVAEAMKEANQEVVNLLQGLYTKEGEDGATADIKLLDPSSKSGWEAIEEDYENADIIEFNGTKIDIFDNDTGNLLVSTTGDAEAEIKDIDIAYDWEGSGDWEDSSYTEPEGYGDEVGWDRYDDG
jgi:hypothetical protein